MRCFEIFDNTFDQQSAVAPVTSFAIGAFPLIVRQLVATTIKKFPPFQATLPSLNASQLLNQIDGISIYGIRTATALECACRASISGRDETSEVPPFEGEDGRRFRSIIAAMYDCPNFALVRNWRGIAGAHLSEVDLTAGKPRVPVTSVAAE